MAAATKFPVAKERYIDVECAQFKNATCTLGDVAHVRVNMAATIPGSLPNGGSVPGIPIFSLDVDTMPEELRFPHYTREARRRDLRLIDGGLAFIIDEVVPAKVAKMLMRITEDIGYNEAAPGIQTPPGMRMNKALHLLLPDTFSESVFNHIQHLLPQELDGDRLKCLSSRLNCYKYDDGDIFRIHVDGDWPGYGLDADGHSMVEWEGMRSKISLLLYLNDELDGVQGGATRLYSTQGSSRRDKPVDVQPSTGSALFFRHGFGDGSILHEGARVGVGTSKYVCRINVMYER